MPTGCVRMADCMGEQENRETVVNEASAMLEYDLADAIYAACLADSLRSDSLFYFMDAEDGGSSMSAMVRRVA